MYYAEENEKLKKIVKRIAEGSPGKVTPRPIDALLYSIIRATQPRRCLELGAYEGTTSLYLAQGLNDNEDGELISVEIDESNARGARKHLEEAGISGFAEIKIGDSREVVPDLGGEFDLVFINTAPDQYVEDYMNAKKKLSQNGIIAIDLPDGDEFPELINEMEEEMNVIKLLGYGSLVLAQSKS